MKAHRFAPLFFLLLLGTLVATLPPRYAGNWNGPGAATSGASAKAGGTKPRPPEASQQTAATIIRTIVYRRISDFQEGGGITSIQRLKMSADGSKVIFISGQKVFTIDATGQNLRQVFDAGNDRGPAWIDISANGTKILFAAGYQSYFYTADADGNNRVSINPGFKTRYNTDDALGLTIAPRLTAAGTHVYFTHSGALENTGGYRANVNNTGLTKLFSFEQMAALFGKDGSVYNGNIAFWSSLEISDDGSRLIFGTGNFDNLSQTVAYDSATGLHKLTNNLAGYNDRYIALSGDGNTAVIVGATGYPENRTPAVAMDFSGANSRELLRDTGAIGAYVGVMGMSTDGKQVITNARKTTSILYTDGSGQLDLNVFQCALSFADPVGGANAGHDANAASLQSMTADGRRYAFVSRQNPNQIWVGDINPSTPGDNPVISEVNFNPAWVLADGSTSSTFTARVTGGQGGIRHSCIDSLKNNTYQFRAFSGDLFDDGTHGDATAADSRYTNNNVRRDLAAADLVSPYTVRFYGYANSLKQITAVDAVPFFILNTAPAGSGPHIDAITPSSGRAGIQIKITGSGFSPIASENIVVFGSRQAYVKSANAARTELEVIVPSDLAPGVYPVTVTVAAQTSNSVNFTVTGDSACTYSISPTSQNFPASGGSGSVNVTAQRGSSTLKTTLPRVNYTTASNNASRIVANPAAPVTPEDGDWAARTATLTNTTEADLMARTGDIDNLNFGWPSGFNPFSGNSTPSHGFPWTIDANDPAGTDRIMVITSYNGSPPAGQDGYTGTTSRPANSVQSIVLNYSLGGITVNSARLQLFVDDFQAPVWQASYQVTINGVRAQFLEEVINSLNQTGPIGKLISVQIPQAYLSLVASGQLTINVDDKTTGAGDGYAIDFVKLLVNPKAITQKGTIIGTVTSSATQQPLAGVTVSAGGIVEAQTGTDGKYTLNDVPAGLVIVKASKSGYASKTASTDLIAGQTMTVNFSLDLAPVIEVTPTSLDFGVVSSGQNKTLQLTVKNTGAGPLSVTTVASDNSVFSVTSATSFAVPAGQQQTVSMRFAPANSSPQAGTLTINNNDPTRPSVTVSLTGNGGVACAWTATSNASWITITSGTPGTDNGTVSYSVSANTGPARSGTITIAGLPFTVTQDAGTSGCTYAIAPTSQSFAVGGGTGSVNVTTQTGCAWTATSNAAWITVTAGTPGQGSGVVSYSVAANTGTDSRTGTITIAGLTFTVTQAGTSGAGPLIRIVPTTLNFNVPKPQASLTQAPATQPATQRPDSAKPQTAGKPDRSEPRAFPRPENEHEPEGELRRDFMEWFYEQRAYPQGQIPAGVLRRAWEVQQENVRELKAAQEAAAISPTQWSFIGPAQTTGGRWSNVSGRVTTIIVHPNNPNVVYVGGAQGGVWKTSDNGASWTPLTDNQISLAMGALAFDPTNPNIIYAGTGEQHYSLDSYQGTGILKSTDGGASWNVLGADVFVRQTISRMLVSQSDSQVVFAASDLGLYRSANGGDSWTRVLAGAVNDIVAAPGAPTTLYAGLYSNGIYKSTDGGSNWVKLSNGLPASGNIRRAHLAIAGSSSNTLLAVFADTSYRLEGLYRTTDGGASWTRLGNTPEVFGGQGFYNISLAIHPTNPSVYYLGGVMLWRSSDGGASWSNVSNPNGYQRDVHPDQHVVAFSPQNPSVVWLGCDGGVWRSDNGGDTWINRNNGLGIMQFQSVGLHPSDDRVVYGGTQDNGTQRYSGDETWREIFGGDGGTTIVDFGNPTTVFTTYVYGNMARSSDSGSNWVVATGGIPISDGRVDTRVGFYAPFTMDPSNSQRLAFGSYRVWYTTNSGDNWTSISGDLGGGGLVSAVTIGAGGSRIWAGTSDARVWRGDFASGSWSWTNVNKAPLPGKYVTRFAAHPTDPQIAYVSFSGFDTDHVFRTADGGATWTSASGGLPNLPVNVVLIDPNNTSTVYAGTDLGVYRSTDQGQSWTVYGTNLPNVAIFDMAVNKSSGVLRVATHGRGMWEIQTGGEQGFTIFNDGSSVLRITGITKQNNSAWLSFTPPQPIPFEIAPGSSVTVRVGVNAAGLNAGSYSDRLLVTSNDTARSPYPDGVYVNLNVFGGAGCEFAINPSGQAIAASGGTSSVSVTTASGCLWTAVSNNSWITVTSGASGQGNGTVNFNVTANTSASERTGTMTIAGLPFVVTQAGGSNCTFTIAPTSQSFDASGGTGNVAVTTQAGCNWTATSNAAWVAITSGAGGAGSGQISYVVAANTSASPRTGTITIAGLTFTVTQAGGSGCTFAISPTAQSFTDSGGAGSVFVLTQSDCRWTAASNAAWIAIIGGASGNGPGTVNFVVANNPNQQARTGTLAIAGLTFTVTQNAASGGCILIPIGIGQTVNGALTNTDCWSPIFEEPFYVDRYSFYAAAGQQVAILLTSSAFDSFLFLVGPDGEIIYADDDGGGGSNSRIPENAGYLTLPESGTYIIEVGGYFERSLGNYTLSLSAPGGCTYALAPESKSFGSAGGNDSVSVNTQNGCAFTAASNVPWVIVTAGGSGQGSGLVSYTVAANNSASSRSGTLTIAGLIFTITQAGGSNCSFSISPTSQSVAASGGSGSVSVNTQNGCNWTAVSQSLWITISSGASGSGGGSVNFMVAANNGGPRAGTIVIAGQTFTVNQAGSSNCNFTISPASRSFTASGGYDNVTVAAPSGCVWMAASNVSWLTLAIGSDTGSGNGAVSFTVATNTGSARTGTLTIGGQTFTINQSGAGAACPTISGINPTSGVIGSTVTITGANLTGATAVKFSSNVAAQFTVNSDTQITATVPTGAVTGPITISKTACNDVQTASFTISASQCITVAIATNLTGAAGGSLTAPITVSDTTGKGVIAYDFTLTYDPSVLRLQATPFDRTGTLSAALSITTNTSVAGQLRLSAFGTTALAGAGTLLNLKFDLIGAVSTCGNLTWASFRFNEGTPCATTTNGRVCVAGGAISGTVNYCITPKAVPGVTVTAAGTPQAQSTTSSAGAYQLTGLGGGPYTVTLAKTGDVNGIASFDAALIAQHVVGLTTLNSCQQAAGDSSGDGSLSSFDAALIAQFVVGITNPASQVGTWKFVPPNRSYTTLSGDQSNQNFDAVLVGDVSGNWAAGATLSKAEPPSNAELTQQAVQVSLPTLVAGAGGSLVLPITVGDLTGRGVLAYDFDLVYDANLLQAQSQPVDATDTLSGNFTVTLNATPGRLRVSGFGTMPLSGSGVLLKLRFNVIGGVGNSATLNWQKFQFNEGNPAATPVNGRVTVINISTLSLTPASQNIALGASASLTLVSSVAQPIAVTYPLTSSNAAIASVPASVTIPANATMATFAVTANTVGGPVTITAGFPPLPGALVATATVTVIRPVACVSAASFLGQLLASETIVAAFGTSLATRTEIATTVPLPTQLAGTTVQVRDSAGTARLAPLFFVSEGQINYLIPAGTAAGTATVTVTSGNGAVSTGTMLITSVAPGLFAANANGQGVAAADALRIRADSSQIYEPVSRWDATLRQFVSVPIDLGPESEQVYLILYGTGLRFASSLPATSVTAGGIAIPVLYVGPQGDFVGLDQINLGPVPRSLAGRGEVDVVMTVDGKTANTVKVNFR